MKPDDYIQNELQHCTDYVLTADDRSAIDKCGVENFIYAKLTSKRFRKWSLDESSELQARRAIEINVATRKPLQFRFPFGGYKLWRMPGSPEVDWAEFFTIAYYCKYLAPIVAAYEPGVEFLFASDDVIIERMDNVPASDTDRYFSSFKQLLNLFAEYFPANLKMNIVRIGDLYADKDLMEAELATNLEHFKQVYAETTDTDKKQKMLTTSALNIQWDGAKDLTGLSEEQKRSTIEMGPVYHDAYCALSKRKEFNRGEDKIVIFTTVIPNAIAIGTTKSSVTKFWTGYGVLVKKTNNFQQVILSPTQLDAWNSRACETIRVDFMPLRNFNKLKLYTLET